MRPERRSGILFVLSAPSGAGKSTLRGELEKTRDFVYSVSCTTRAPRPGEVNGRDYHFISPEDFETRIHAGAFLEYARVHDHYYGTLRQSVLASLEAGDDVLIDIDTQGAARIRANPHPAIREAYVDLFLLPPDFSELRRRLEARGTESEAQIALRLRNAQEEYAQWPHFRYLIFPGTVAEVLAQTRAIMQSERNASRRYLARQPGEAVAAS